MRSRRTTSAGASAWLVTVTPISSTMRVSSPCPGPANSTWRRAATRSGAGPRRSRTCSPGVGRAAIELAEPDGDAVRAAPRDHPVPGGERRQRALDLDVLVDRAVLVEAEGLIAVRLRPGPQALLADRIVDGEVPRRRAGDRRREHRELGLRGGRDLDVADDDRRVDMTGVAPGTPVSSTTRASSNARRAAFTIFALPSRSARFPSTTR